jgi:hypothetical protein
VDRCPYLSASRTLVQLLLNILTHFYTLHCSKQFCPYFTANCQWISVPFILQTPKDALLHAACPSYKHLVEQLSLCLCSLGTNRLQLNHTCSMSSSDLELQHDQDTAVLPINNKNMQILPLLFEYPSYKKFKLWVCMSACSRMEHQFAPNLKCLCLETGKRFFNGQRLCPRFES